MGDNNEGEKKLSWATELGPTGPGPLTGGRVLGIDLGSRRIGVAVSDDGRRVASALTVLGRGVSHGHDHALLSGVVRETEATLVIVGLPLSLSGGAGPAAQAVLDEVSEMRANLAVPVDVCDERYSTVIARRALAAGGRRPATRRAVVDKMAAAAILQTWLDRQRAWPWPAQGPTSPPQ